MRKMLIPHSRVALFHEKCSDHDEVNAEAMKYWALYHPIPTWRVLAVSLYKAEETKAAQMARRHVYAVTGM